MALPHLPWDAQAKAELLEDSTPRRIVLEQYDRERLSVRRYVSFLGLPDDSAEEIVQEGFLRLYEHLIHGGDRTNLRAWLFKVVRNLAYDEQNSSRIRQVENQVPVTARTPEDELIAEERLAQVRLAIEGLSMSQRECLVLRAQGFKYREIAGVLALSVSTVSEHVQRGIERLKEIL